MYCRAALAKEKAVGVINKSMEDGRETMTD